MSAFALADLGGYDRTTLAQNESAFPPSPSAVAAGMLALERSHLYPDPDWHDLRAAIARVYAVERDLILCGAGSMDLIACTVAAFSGSGDEVLASSYAYNFIASAAARAGARFVKAPENDFLVSVDAILAAAGPRTRIVFVCNPGNPTGTRIANAELLRLRNGLRPDILLIVDQAYGEFDDQDPGPIFDLVKNGATVVLRTLSKAYGLAGARVGWGLFPPSAAAEVRKVQNSNQVTTASLAMAVAAVDDQPYMHDVRDRTIALRKRFAGALGAVGYSIPTSYTNFVLIPFPDAAIAKTTELALGSAGLVVRNMGGYDLGNCLRVTIGADQAMQSALAILTDAARQSARAI